MTRMFRAIAVAIVVASAIVACSHTTGPSPSAVLVSRTLVPTSTVANAASICCCHVQGTVRNTSTIEVDIQLRFAATNVDGAYVGTAADFLNDVPAGATRSFDAAGIQEACARTKTVSDQVLAFGHFIPK